MGMKTVRRIAASILGVGEKRVRFKPDALEEIKEAMTREDVRALISKGLIWAEPEKGTSRARARKLHEQKKKGRRRGHGSRKGKRGARMKRKRAWVLRVRGQRKLLRALKGKGLIKPRVYRKVYRMIKGGYFKSKAHLLSYLKALGE